MTSITTFQPMFVSLHRPYAAVRGERLTVIATVYNYLSQCLNIQLDLDQDSSHRALPRCVCGGESGSHRFSVVPHDIGEMKLEARATVIPGCDNDSGENAYLGYTDAVIRNIKVKAEGVTQEYTSTQYVCSEDGDATPGNDKVMLKLPEDMVEGSERGEIRVIGDIMGPALSNLDHLIRLPTGCGEQNMVGFVPNILVLKYLRQTRRLTEIVEDQCLHHMEIGYQRELNYRHPDGSFSAFGPPGSGSVWLTAFVVKSLAQARPYMYIDEADLSLSTAFLRRSQLETGCFRETGKVLSSYMQGGLAKGKRKERSGQTSLTAYVLIALLKAGANVSEPVISLGLSCINAHFTSAKSRLDSYTLAIVAYANVLADPTSPVSHKVMRVLGSKAKKEGSLKFWQRETKEPPAKASWYFRAAPSAEVEMTSYALLAHLVYHREDAVAKTHDIAMWISQQRNSNGGFASTQDTVLGLSALAEFAGLAYSSRPQEVQVTVSGKDYRATHNVSEFLRSSLLLHTTHLPSLPNTLHIHTLGQGCALVQAHVEYNKLPAAIQGDDKPSFYLRVRPRLYTRNVDMCHRRTLDITVGARGPQKFSTGMSILELKMLTGWSPVMEDLTLTKAMFPRLGIQRHEYKEDEGLLVLYFDELSRKAKKFQIHLEQDTELKVLGAKPAEVTVYQYYETDVTLSRSYTIKTTCGTKAEIPRLPSPNMPDWVQRRVDDVELLPSVGRVRAPPAPEIRVIGCPFCPATKSIPSDLQKFVCNASQVYKAVAGRNGAKPIKLKFDLLSGEKLSSFSHFDLPEGCKCSLLEKPAKRVVIFAKDKAQTPKATLVLDETSAVMLAYKPLEKAVRRANRKCIPSPPTLPTTVAPVTTDSGAQNILGTNLELCSLDPKTGWFRDGFCNTDDNDSGTHVVCANMTEEFLTFTKSQGNDLSTQKPWFPGLKPGDGWCLCALRWREAYRAGKAPNVNTGATHSKALDYINKATLQKFDVNK